MNGQQLDEFTCGLCGRAASTGFKTKIGVLRRCAECYCQDAARAYMSADGMVYDKEIDQFRPPTQEEEKRQANARAAWQRERGSTTPAAAERSMSKLRKIATEWCDAADYEEVD